MRIFALPRALAATPGTIAQEASSWPLLWLYILDGPALLLSPARFMLANSPDQGLPGVGVHFTQTGVGTEIAKASLNSPPLVAASKTCMLSESWLATRR